MNMERDFRYTDLLSKGYYFDTITAPDFNHLSFVGYCRWL